MIRVHNYIVIYLFTFNFTFHHIVLQLHFSLYCLFVCRCHQEIYFMFTYCVYVMNCVVYGRTSCKTVSGWWVILVKYVLIWYLYTLDIICLGTCVFPNQRTEPNLAMTYRPGVCTQSLLYPFLEMLFLGNGADKDCRQIPCQIRRSKSRFVDVAAGFMLKYSNRPGYGK